VLSRRSHRVVVAAALAAIGFGLFASVGAAPSWQWNRADQISSLPTSDQATVATPDRRVMRAQAATSIEPLLGLTFGAATDLIAVLAIAAIVLMPRHVRRSARIEQYLARALRSPPAPVPALVPVR
jgi:hypothetical protein